ncbi:MAG: DUF5009 domain-containing protein [Deltaproteobacteria bacterium]|nr:DUF5009 domain-containing protein [Deltaproteobacteria bacterium]
MEPSDRYPALDVLRGTTIALMILVNTPGSWQYVYAPFEHSAWHGCTAADLVFPFFLFAAGVSLFFSQAQYQNALSRQSLWRVGRRTLLIFIIGLFINSYPQWLTDYAHLRIMGVLQRIALAYGLAALLVLCVPRRLLPGAGAFILLAYWGILYFFGGSDPYSLSGNATIPLDRAILGESHLYRGFGIPFDPEGILSSLPAAVTVVIGYLAGRMLCETEIGRVPLGLMFHGLAAVFAGYVWGYVFPINKPLWTSSYVLYTAGLAALAFAVLIYIIEQKGYRKWTVLFSVFGMNPLFLFVLSILWGKTLRQVIGIPAGDGTATAGSTWVYQNMFVPWAGLMNGSLAYALTHVVLIWLVGYALFKLRIFIKV